MSLISNLSVTFSSTFPNLLGGPGPELRDINNSLARSINDHISQPGENKSFVPEGFGTTWKESYSEEGLPTDVLNQLAEYLDPLIRPILSDAVAALITNVGILMNAATPATAQASVPLVLTALNNASGLASAGAPALISTLNTAVGASTTPAGLAALPAAVGGVISGIAGLVTIDRLSLVPYASSVNQLDFDLENVGLSNATGSRASAWAIVVPQILTILPPVNILGGPLGVNFWNSLLITLQQAVPGIRAT